MLCSSMYGNGNIRYLLIPSLSNSVNGSSVSIIQVLSPKFEWTIWFDGDDVGLT